jgi:hypothetical protein
VAKVLAVGVYLADRPHSASHLVHELTASAEHDVVQRWVALAPGGRGRFDVPATEMVVTELTPKFALLDRLTDDAEDFDWVLLCDDDVEVGSCFVDRLIGVAEQYDFALSQPARTSDSFIDHPIVQVMPGLSARRTRFVEIGPITCLRRDAARLLLPFGEACHMGWGLDFVWPVRLERAGLRMGIIDAAPVAHRIRRSGAAYDSSGAHRAMCSLLAREAHLSADDAFVVLEPYR